MSATSKHTYRDECAARLIGNTSAVRADSRLGSWCGTRQRSKGDKSEERSESHWRGDQVDDSNELDVLRLET